MDFNFEEHKPNRARGYFGASVKKSGVYLTKSLLAEVGINKGDRVKLMIDKENDAFQLVRSDEGGFKITNSDGAGGAFVGGEGESDKDFYEKVELTFGRYELEEDADGTLTFVYNPDL